MSDEPNPEALHHWPPPEAHLWSKWWPNTARQFNPPKPPTQYRTCMHPDCDEIEYREAPRS